MMIYITHRQAFGETVTCGDLKGCMSIQLETLGDIVEKKNQTIRIF